MMKHFDYMLQMSELPRFRRQRIDLDKSELTEDARNYIDKWELIKYEPKELALMFIEKLENETNRRQWCADMREQGLCETECIDCIMAAVREILES